MGDTHWTVLDAHGGVDDINDGVLRHVSDAFAEDPLRVLRVARYAARYEMRVADETKEMMRTVAPELNRMSRDRIEGEVVKAMRQARKPSRFWEVLRDTGALAVLWPELDRATIIPAGPEEHHAEGSTFKHTMMVLDRMHELLDESEYVDSEEDRVKRLLMAVAHDVGKVPIADEKGGIHSDDPPTGFPGHTEIGAAVLRDTARRLGLRGEYEEAMREASSHHMRVHDMPSMPAGVLMSFTEQVDDLGAMIDLAHADHEGRLRRERLRNVEVHTDEGGMTIHDRERFEEDGMYSLGERHERPEFDREAFVEIEEALTEVTGEMDGYTVLDERTCDEHSAHDFDDAHSGMSQCDDCTSPGRWVGDRLDEKRTKALTERLDD